MAEAIASACLVAGLCAITVGAWLVAPWVGLVVGGGLATAASLAFLVFVRLRSSLKGERVSS